MKMATHIMSLTYAPKIDAVKSGQINQTIRLVRSLVDKKKGDKLILHTWEGKPYRSKWGWRLETRIKESLLLMVDDHNEWWIYDNLDFERGLPIQPHWRQLFLDELMDFAKLDGIDPPTFGGLCHTLAKLNGLSSLAATYWNVIRWEPIAK
jgi:hypothetical protein